MPTRSISEERQFRYLLGLCSKVECEQIESEYFADEDVFQEMLTAEDDLIDAYARGELAGLERRQFEKCFVRSSLTKDRVHFARAFVGAGSSASSVEPKLAGKWPGMFKIFPAPGLPRSATLAVVIVFIALFAWLVIERRRMHKEFTELRAESAKLYKQTEELQQSSDSERARATELATQLANLQAQPDKPRQSAQREKPINNQTATLGSSFVNKTIIQLPLEARNVPSLLTLQTATTRGGYVRGSRADQTNITLDDVDINEPLNIDVLKPQNTTSNGDTVVRGTVRDPQGNLVSGATVTLTNPAKNFTKTQSASKDGAYVFTAIPPGTYSLNVKAPGFKSVSALDVAAVVQNPTIVDVQLEIGDVSETVTINAATTEALSNRADASLGSSFTPKRITQLPLEANNVVGLYLQPGVSTTASRVKLQLVLESATIYEDYRVIINKSDGSPIASLKPLALNQTIVETPAISIDDLQSGEYVLFLTGKKADGSFVKIAEYSFKVIKH